MTPPTVNAYYNPLAEQHQLPRRHPPAALLQRIGRRGRQLRRRRRRHRPRADARLRRRGASVRRAGQPARLVDAGGWQGVRRARRLRRRRVLQFTAVDDVKVNGKLTLGENTADNGGLRHRADGVSGDAHRRRSRRRSTASRRSSACSWAGARSGARTSGRRCERMHAGTDPHAPNRYRVNGVVSNMPEFQKAFSCKADAPMVRQNACRVW